MNLLQLQNGSKSFGAKQLFFDASFSVNEGEHIGLIGPNGAGKSTLFKILVNHLELDSGILIKSQKLKIAYLEQESDWNLEINAEKLLTESCELPLWQLKQKSSDLGLTPEDFTIPLKNLSGGYRMRFKLLQLIGQNPNLMLLDEPTNFLDLETVLILENFLQNYEGAYLLISHDREFLKRTTDHIIEVEQGEITKYPGNIDDYFEQKALILEQQQKTALNQAVKREAILDFVKRFGAKATKAKQAQSRLKRLEKMEHIEIKALPVRAKINIPIPSDTGKEILNLKNTNWGYPGKTVLENVNLRLLRGDHLGIVGFNGAGKSTLLKGLSGILKPQQGELQYGYQVQVGYFSQHSSERLNPEATILESLQATAHTSIKNQEILNLAGSLLFSGDDVYKKIKVLSGGEKSRVALGQILLLKAPVLLLDEPTNHLDFDTVEALTQALQNYDGSIIVVSHDRGFIARVATKILEIKNRKAEFYPGTYEDYLWSLEKGVLSLKSENISNNTNNFKSNFQNSTADSKNENTQSKLNYAVEKKRLEKEMIIINRNIKKIETEIAELTSKQQVLTNNLLASNGSKAKDLAFDLNELSKNILKLEDSLLFEMEKNEQLERELRSLFESTNLK